MIVVLVLAVLVLLSRAGRWPIAVMVGVVFVVRVRIAISIQSRLGDGRPLVLAAFRPPAAFAAAATTAPTPRTAFFVQLSGLGCRLAATSLAALLVGELLVVIRSFDVRRSVVHEFEFLVARFAGEIGALFLIERLAARRVVSPAALAGSARRSAARFAAA